MLSDFVWNFDLRELLDLPGVFSAASSKLNDIWVFWCHFRVCQSDEIGKKRLQLSCKRFLFNFTNLSNNWKIKKFSTPLRIILDQFEGVDFESVIGFRLEFRFGSGIFDFLGVFSSVSWKIIETPVRRSRKKIFAKKLFQLSYKWVLFHFYWSLE